MKIYPSRITIVVHGYPCHDGGGSIDGPSARIFMEMAVHAIVICSPIMTLAVRYCFGHFI
jgi:hypothetical protein